MRHVVSTHPTPNRNGIQFYFKNEFVPIFHSQQYIPFFGLEMLLQDPNAIRIRVKRYVWLRTNAAMTLNIGIAHKIKRSSLCGKIEYKLINIIA